MFVLFRDGLSQQPKIFERQEKVNGHSVGLDTPTTTLTCAPDLSFQTNGPQIVKKYIHLWLKKVKKHKEIYERNDKGTIHLHLRT